MQQPHTMASSVGFRHRLKRRHFEEECMRENKRHLSEKMAQELGVLKLDDSAHAVPSVSSPPRYNSEVV